MYTVYHFKENNVCYELKKENNKAIDMECVFSAPEKVISFYLCPPPSLSLPPYLFRPFPPIYPCTFSQEIATLSLGQHWIIGRTCQYQARVWYWLMNRDAGNMLWALGTAADASKRKKKEVGGVVLRWVCSIFHPNFIFRERIHCWILERAILLYVFTNVQTALFCKWFQTFVYGLQDDSESFFLCINSWCNTKVHKVAVHKVAFRFKMNNVSTISWTSLIVNYQTSIIASSIFFYQNLWPFVLFVTFHSFIYLKQFFFWQKKIKTMVFEQNNADTNDTMGQLSI